MKDLQNFNDPKRLFALWKEFAGEDLLNSVQDKKEKKEEKR